MIPPSPRSTLGDTEALKTIVDANTSLMIPVVVLRRPVVIVEAVTVEALTTPPPLNPGAFRVETFSVEMLPKPAFILEVLMLDNVILFPILNVDTLRVEVVMLPALRLDTLRVE
jgi:hypothetical protein